VNRVADPTAAIAGRVPDGWLSPWFPQDGTMGLDWSGILPAAETKMMDDGWSDTFSAFFALMVGRCRLTVSNPMLKALVVSALEATT